MPLVRDACPLHRPNVGGAYIYTVSLDGTLSTPVTARRSANGTARAGWRFEGTDPADIDRRQGAYSYYNDWVSPNTPDPSGDHDIRATRQSGTETTLTVGTLNTWQNLSTNRSYEIHNNVNGTTKTMLLKIEIRDTATQTLQDTGYYYIKAIDTGGGTTTTTTTVPPTTLPPTSL
jgi:hypothetical protein